jgi:hypothetical protein
MANVKFRCRHKVGQQGKRPIYCNMPLDAQRRCADDGYDVGSYK